jgi:hypothetical protein
MGTLGLTTTRFSLHYGHFMMLVTAHDVFYPLH